jgi:hypothetical protein
MLTPSGSKIIPYSGPSRHLSFAVNLLFDVEDEEEELRKALALSLQADTKVALWNMAKLTRPEQLQNISKADISSCLEKSAKTQTVHKSIRGM